MYVAMYIISHTNVSDEEWQLIISTRDVMHVLANLFIGDEAWFVHKKNFLHAIRKIARGRTIYSYAYYQVLSLFTYRRLQQRCVSYSKKQEVSLV